MDRHPLRRLPALAIALALTAGAALGGCGDDNDEPNADDRSTEGAVTAPRGEVAVADGAVHFAASCAACHGTDLRGTDRGPSLLSEVYEPGHHPDDAFRAAIVRGSRAHHWGFGDMPPVDDLDPGQIETVIAYIRDQQATHGFEPYPPR